MRVQDDFRRTPSEASSARLALERELQASGGHAEAWKDRVDRDALAIYLLRGGVKFTAWSFAANAASPDEQALLRGAIALAENKPADARRFLEPLDPLSAPPGVAGPLALARARLWQKGDSADQSYLLRLARLLEPGGLVEETALRQEIFLATEQNDVDRFIDLSRRYANRFQQSTYASNFLSRFESYYVRAWIAANDADRERIDRVLDQFSAHDQTELRLSLGREALLSGDLEGARTAVSRVGNIEGLAAQEAARSRLYELVPGIFGAGRQDILEKFEKIDTAALPREDIAILSAARSIAETIGGAGAAAQSAARREAYPAADVIRASLADADRALEQAK
ncbi:MAG: hypothetical protein KGM42_02330 [Hyphomicrobiales bacterium]|nr:hypothetical protein [Hyphomicrobiales bacterium]